MNYDLTKLQNKPVPKDGDRVKAVVKTVTKGVLKDFVPESVIATWDGRKPEDAALEVSVTTEDGYNKTKVINYPENHMVSPKSVLAKWKKVYGQYPHDGQQIELVADEEGYYQFLF